MDCLNIYSLDGCYYSQSLEELLNNKKIKYNELDLQDVLLADLPRVVDDELVVEQRRVRQARQIGRAHV